jgi:DnaJ-class molecular chaperone
MCIVKRFKHMALLLHPDKNAHPLAKDAFQKLKAAYDMASYHNGAYTSTFNYYN